MSGSQCHLLPGFQQVLRQTTDQSPTVFRHDLIPDTSGYLKANSLAGRIQHENRHSRLPFRYRWSTIVVHWFRRARRSQIFELQPCNLQQLLFNTARLQHTFDSQIWLDIYRLRFFEIKELHMEETMCCASSVFRWSKHVLLELPDSVDPLLWESTSLLDATRRVTSFCGLHIQK